MTRRPIDQLSPEQRREGIWVAIRRLRRFTLRELWMEARLEENSIRDYVIGLTAAGYLAEDGTAPGLNHRPAKCYRLVKDVGIDAPRVTRDGVTVTQGQGRQQLWRTMRILGEFSWRELAIAASTEDCLCHERDAQYYCQHLHKAGYLALVKKGRGTGKGGQPGIYRLLPSKYTGPKPPQIQRVKQVFDPNLNAVVWSGGDHDSN